MINTAITSVANALNSSSGIINSIKNAGQAVASAICNSTDNRFVKFLGTVVEGATFDTANALAVVATQPSLCYVPIQAEKLSVRRQADVSSTMLISQSTQTKSYITDNTAPKPRTWTVQGYLTSVAPSLENGIAIKPSLLMQESVLNTAFDTRDTVKFKTDTGEVYDVLIVDLLITKSAKGPGVREISVTVQEINVLTSSNNYIADISAQLDEKASKSIVKTSWLNLGKTMSTWQTIPTVAVAAADTLIPVVKSLITSGKQPEDSASTKTLDFQQGHDVGYVEGVHDGYEKGYDEATKAHADDYQNGYNAATEEHAGDYQNGYEDGYVQGYKDKTDGKEPVYPVGD